MAQQDPKKFSLPGVVTVLKDGEKWYGWIGEGKHRELPAEMDPTDIVSVRAWIQAQDAKDAPHA